jgi:CubicO group peptidase (beta-lactamase class C family)
LNRLDTLLARAVTDGVFPLARAEVFYGGRRVYSGGNAPETTWFDLASVSKVISTTALYLALAREKEVDGAMRLRKFFPEAAADVSLDDLLFHRSGLPPFLQFFDHEMNAHPDLFHEDCPAELRAQVRASVVRRALAVRPASKPGEHAVYSDIGFMLLGEVISHVAAQPLDDAFEKLIAQPLSLAARYRRLSARRPMPELVAPTGKHRPRDPAPGQEGTFDVEPRRTRPGEVDDDNCWCMDGVSGHAGVFGTAEAVARFGQTVLDGVLAPPEPWAKDTHTPGSTRALGFDTPSDEAPSCGPRIGYGALAIGHLGFTGTSVWIDFSRHLVIALLTNRVAGVKGRADLRIKEFRPRFHDAVLDHLDIP